MDHFAFKRMVRLLRLKAEGQCSFLNCVETRKHLGQKRWRCPECKRVRGPYPPSPVNPPDVS
jgi:hypothetical protein